MIKTEDRMKSFLLSLSRESIVWPVRAGDRAPVAPRSMNGSVHLISMIQLPSVIS